MNVLSKNIRNIEIFMLFIFWETGYRLTWTPISLASFFMRHHEANSIVPGRDFPTVSKQGPGTNDFGKNNTYISQIGKMDTKHICTFGVNLRIFLQKKKIF